MDFDRFFAQMDRYFERTLAEHGPTPLGVDWNSPEAQTSRFDQLLKVVDSSKPYSINDYGCGYGALAHYLRERGDDFTYRGLDVSERMLEHARELNAHPEEWSFVSDPAELAPADYTVASGLFNLRMEIDDDAWREYVLDTLDRIAELSELGFAFNMLTSYSDPDKMRPDLYYGDPCFFFDRCKRRYARDVALLHDYGLYEFTILVRRDASAGG
jgi:SAM-dependent methyltransferase